MTVVEPGTLIKVTETTTPTGDKVLTPAKRSITETLKLLKASEISDEYGLNMVLFGSPGVGKTVLAASAQDSEYGRDVLFIDVEGGTRSIADRSDIDVVTPENFADIFDVYRWLHDNPEGPYKTIVIDTLNEVQKMGLKEIMKTAKDPEFPNQQDWGRSHEQVTRLVRAFRLFAQERGWNVVFIAHANKQKDEVLGTIMISPNLTPKATEAVCGIVDVVGYMSKNQEGERILRLEPTSTIEAKYRQPMTGKRLPEVIINPTMSMILGHLRTPS